jgi:hypothetical protein
VLGGCSVFVSRTGASPRVELWQTSRRRTHFNPAARAARLTRPQRRGASFHDCCLLPVSLIPSTSGCLQLFDLLLERAQIEYWDDVGFARSDRPLFAGKEFR